jgi:hypothetical protein
MKLKNDILTQQERVLCEKDKELAAIKNEFKDAQENMLKNGEENKELKASLNKKTLELDEAAKLLKKDEHSKKDVLLSCYCQAYNHNHFLRLWLSVVVVGCVCDNHNRQPWL